MTLANPAGMMTSDSKSGERYRTSAAEGHPNCIEPGKRPRITLTPTIVLKDRKPLIAISVAGGDGQDQAALQVLLNLLDFNLSPVAAVVAPRFGTNHHLGSFRQTPPQLGSLLIDAEMDE